MLLSLTLVIVTVILSALACKILLSDWFAVHLLDIPNDRSLHDRPIPRSGGIAIMTALAAGYGLSLFFEANTPLAEQVRSSFYVLAVAWGLFGFSLVDDKKGLSVILRLVVHLSAIVVLLLILTRFSLLQDFTSPNHIFLFIFLLISGGWMINLFNFMDGSDGLAGGVACIGFAALALFSYLAHNLLMGLICSLVSASTVGFLLFNWSPAKIFMGDSGSIPLGFLIFAISLEGCLSSTWHWSTPVIVFSPFWLDATITLFRRALRRERIWQAHREHYYQRLILLGWSHRRTALAYYAMVLLCAIISYFLVISHSMPFFLSLLPLFFLAAVYAIILISIDIHWYRAQHIKTATMKASS